MEITAGTDQQTEFTGQDRQGAYLFSRHHAVDHFQRMPACLNIVGNQPAALAAG
ncbi:hypothetical protein D3C84_895370 [compost metagenome]